MIGSIGKGRADKAKKRGWVCHTAARCNWTRGSMRAWGRKVQRWLRASEVDVEGRKNGGKRRLLKKSGSSSLSSSSSLKRKLEVTWRKHQEGGVQ